MGLNFMDINPIPHITSPLKGEEQDKLAHMRRRGNPVASNNWMPDQVRHDGFLEVPINQLCYASQATGWRTHQSSAALF